MTSVGVCSEGKPWVVHANGTIFGLLNGKFRNFLNETANDIFFGKDTKLYIHEKTNNPKKDSKMMVFNHTHLKFDEIKGSKSHSADVSAKGHIVAVKHDGKVKVAVINNITHEMRWFKVKKDVRVQDVAIADDDTLAVVDKKSQ